MTNHYDTNTRITHHRQTGVALFFALIALLVMSLAAVALIRSVDTNTQIAGNLSYRQTATLSTSLAQEALADVLGQVPFAKGEQNGVGGSSVTSAPVGYYATCSTFDSTGASKCIGDKLTMDSIWVPGIQSAYASGNGITNGKDLYGNTVQYIVERMCANTGTANGVNCLLDGLSGDNGSHGTIGENVAGAPSIPKIFPVFRVTVRIDGPKNTVTYAQAFMS